MMNGFTGIKKRIFDILCASAGLMLLSPAMALFSTIIWLQDKHSPLFIANRAGKDGVNFKMIKLRTMIAGADKFGIDSTANDDKRITWVGHFVRKYKIDEFMQLWNVLKGEMSLVGPRPNTHDDVKSYTEEERLLLGALPGITDLASIVFSDEGKILSGANNPDLLYCQIIRPWKSRLGLVYIQNRNLRYDIMIIILTITAIFSRNLALQGVQLILSRWKADKSLMVAAKREKPLQAYPPPGAKDIIKEYRHCP